MTERIILSVNGRRVELDTDPTKPLLYVLRDELELRGTRFGCGTESCGACMVLLDDAAVYSCSRDVASCQGKEITTLEGLSADGSLHPVQQALIDLQAGQCGYCLSGIQMSAIALLRRNARPSRQEIREALDPNLCRCGVHNRVVSAVERAAAMMAKTP